jgi:uncharacterized protein (TIGR03000 family)
MAVSRFVARWPLAAWLVFAGLSTLLGPGAQAAPVPHLEQASPQRSRQDAAQAARLIVTVPHPDTVLSLDGRIVVGAGTTRSLETPPLGAQQRSFTLTASWNPNTYTTMTRTKIVSLRAGEDAAIDLSREDPGDRVRVIYVPTPPDIADEMVTLARVTSADVVFEPGCGDARITIAAVKAGAKRAICVDLDPERAQESLANVQTSGLADRIDVRQGDALDVKDLSEVTVVFLYMGDHFNQLIRPVLWRSLAPGARIVSHRFTMGDWEPDKTVTVQSVDGGGTYDLHLWTITADVKRKAPR